MFEPGDIIVAKCNSLHSYLYKILDRDQSAGLYTMARLADEEFNLSFRHHIPSVDSEFMLHDDFKFKKDLETLLEG